MLNVFCKYLKCPCLSLGDIASMGSDTYHRRYRGKSLESLDLEGGGWRYVDDAKIQVHPEMLLKTKDRARGDGLQWQ